MNCEHFVFNGEVKCDVRVRALYRIKVHIKGLLQNFQSVLSNINSYRFLITRNTFFIDCVVNHHRVEPTTATGPETRAYMECPPLALHCRLFTDPYKIPKITTGSRRPARKRLVRSDWKFMALR